MLVDGKWTAEWHPVQAKDEKGGFVRQTSSFRNWVTPDGSAGPTGEGGFAAEAGRYHLYVALICPWASRTLIGRKLKKLDDVISVSVVEPALTDQGWRFGDYPGSDRDDLNGATYLHEIYTRADPTFTGRATVPVLWDKRRGTIVSNESADILRMLNAGFGSLADETVDLYPANLRDAIDALNARIYPSLNNGVYRTGFATTQWPTRIDAELGERVVEQVVRAAGSHVKDNTKAFYGETIPNPKNDVFDIEGVSGVAHNGKFGIPLIMDNTVPSPYLIRPLECVQPPSRELSRASSTACVGFMIRV